MEFILVIVGLLIIAGTYYKPDFYWESRKAKSLRGIFGDKGTAIFYYAIGAFALCYSLLALFGLIETK